MAILLGQSLIREGGTISELTRQAVAFIDGGPEWLRWALHGPEIKAQFTDESQMAGAIQNGLHGSPFAYLPCLGLMVSPIKLMTLSIDDLQLVARAEIDPSNRHRNERVRAIFDLHGLLTNEQLKEGMDWLATLKLPQLDLFQVVTFEEQVAIRELMQWLKEHKTAAVVPADAALFALSESRTPMEFVDFFHAYVGVAEKLSSVTAKNGKASEPIAEAAQAAVRLLSPLAFGALDCPQTAPLSSPDDVMLAVELWAASGRALGFPRISTCVREIILHTRLVGDEEWFRNREAWARNRVETYLETVRALTLRAKVHHPFMGQDGATCQYSMAAGDFVARIQLDPSGIISLMSLQHSSSNGKVINLFELGNPTLPTKEDTP